MTCSSAMFFLLCLGMSAVISEVSSSPSKQSRSLSEESCLKRGEYGIIHNPKHNLDSSALYLRIYLPKKLDPASQLKVRHRVLKAFRVASKRATFLTPTAVILYARVNFPNKLDFLNKTYLEVVLGETAALGVDGIILWGKSKYQCLVLKDYMENVVGDHVVQLRRGVQRCSQMLCAGHGRCKRQQPHSGHMIPLGEDMPDIALLRKTFQCVCERGWSGKACEKRDKSDTLSYNSR